MPCGNYPPQTRACLVWEHRQLALVNQTAQFLPGDGRFANADKELLRPCGR